MHATETAPIVRTLGVRNYLHGDGDPSPLPAGEPAVAARQHAGAAAVAHHAVCALAQAQLLDYVVHQASVHEVSWAQPGLSVLLPVPARGRHWSGRVDLHAGSKEKGLLHSKIRQQKVLLRDVSNGALFQATEADLSANS